MEKMQENKHKIKLGQINFINCLPVNLPFQICKQSFDSRFEFSLTEGVPSVLNTSLRQNLIDIAPISSFEYLTNKALYALVPGLSITSFEQADSVILCLKKNLPIREVKEIFLTNKSASSVNLLKILLQEYWHLDLSSIKFTVFNEDPGDCSAKLLIGDEALKQKFLHNDFDAIDLGTIWHEYSSLPMVFGLWTFNIKADCYLDLSMRDSIINLLNSCRDQGLDKFFPDLIVEAYRQTGLPKKILANYFKNLNYDFNSSHQKGLDYYEKKLRECNLIKEPECK
jgi:chorismate dehydratase